MGFQVQGHLCMSRRVNFDISSLYAVHEEKLQVSIKSSLLDFIIHLIILKILADY